MTKEDIKQLSEIYIQMAELNQKAADILIRSADSIDDEDDCTPGAMVGWTSGQYPVETEEDGNNPEPPSSWGPHFRKKGVEE